MFKWLFKKKGCAKHMPDFDVTIVYEGNIETVV